MIKLKILHLALSLRLGGAERLLTDLLPLFKEKGIDSDLLLLVQTGSSFEKELAEQGVNIYHTGVNNEYSPFQIKNLAGFLKKRGVNYDLVHAHLFPAQYFLIFSRWLGTPKLPLITTEHNTYNRRRDKAYLRWLERYVYRQYSRIICISDPARANFLRWLPELESKTLIIPNGIDLKRFKMAEPYPLKSISNKLDPKNKIILMVASMSKQKDQATLIKAASLLPDHYHVFLVGDGEQKSYLLKQVESLRLSDRIHFLGFRDDVERLIKSSDLFVLSSHWEGFGLVAVEAMAGGLPVIASDVSGLSEVVSGAGLLFEPGNENQLAERIKQIVSSEKLYKQLKNKGLQKATEYSLSETANRYMKIYKDILDTG